ncbi:hypothetical protein sos41_11580 [Alphaproteobacteria bacterium SO-S41]|nr:hypothetical protein sos41_11580 [Alphaproteobacteria bacterium SO-S41]
MSIVSLEDGSLPIVGGGTAVDRALERADYLARMKASRGYILGEAELGLIALAGALRAARIPPDSRGRLAALGGRE